MEKRLRWLFCNLLPSSPYFYQWATFLPEKGFFSFCNKGCLVIFWYIIPKIVLHMQRFWKQAFDWKGISYKLQHPIVEAGTVFDLAADGVSEHMLKIARRCSSVAYRNYIWFKSCLYMVPGAHCSNAWTPHIYHMCWRYIGLRLAAGPHKSYCGNV